MVISAKVLLGILIAVLLIVLADILAGVGTYGKTGRYFVEYPITGCTSCLMPRDQAVKEAERVGGKVKRLRRYF